MRILLLALVCLVLENCYAQNEVDLIRLTQHHSFTSARSAGMGGAFGALGADMSSLSSNPAGLAFYRRGEFSLATSLDFNNTSTSIYDSSTSDFNTAFKLNSLGYSATQNSPKSGIGKSSFAMAYNRLASFNQNFTQNATNDNSHLDSFRDRAWGLFPDELAEFDPIASLAWEAFLLDPDTTTAAQDDYITAIPFGTSEQETEVKRRGGIGEITVGTGASSDDKIYWGIALGIPIMKFEETYTHKEVTNEDLPLDEFTYTRTLLIEGTGVNLKAGLIIRPAKWLRIGGAYHTGTRFSLSDTFSDELESKFTDGDNPTPPVFDGFFDYSIRTPSRYFINTAFILGKKAVIALDFDRSNYSKGSISPSDTGGYNFSEENENINRFLGSVTQFKIGAEYRLNNSYRLRTGIRYFENPYTLGVLSDDLDNPLINITAGAGYRYDGFFTDLALDFTTQKSGFTAYDFYIDQAIVRQNILRLNLAAGFRF